MAFTRTTSFAGQTYLSRNSLDSEFNNIANYLNTRVLTSPLSQDLDFGDSYTIQNLRKLWLIRNAAEFGGYTSTAIQAAIDDANAAGEQGFIYLPPGTYSCTRTITLYGGIYLLGTPKAVLQRTSGTFTATNNAFILMDSGIDGCGLLNFTIDGNTVANTSISGLIGVHVREATNVHLDSLQIKNLGASSDGAGSANRGVQIGATQDSTKVWITGCDFDLCMESAVNLVNARRVWIIGNTVTGSASVGDYGISGYNPTLLQDVWIKDNTINTTSVGAGIRLGSNSAGAYADAYSNVTVDDNKIYSAKTYGIHLERMKDSFVTKNKVSAPLSEGIYVVYGSELSIDKNHVLAAGTGGSGATDFAGIKIDGGTALVTNGISLEANRVHDAHGNGILVEGGGSVTVKNVNIVGNTCRDSGRGYTTRCAGIRLDAATGTLSDVTITGNRVFRDDAAAATDHDGVYLDASYVILTSNNLRGSAQGSGVAINRSTGTFIEEGHNHEG